MIDNYSSKGNINLVIGLGKSGFWAAKYLRSINKRVIVWESKDGIEFLERKTELEELNIIVSLNKEFLFDNYLIQLQPNQFFHVFWSEHIYIKVYQYFQQKEHIIQFRRVYGLVDE